MQPPTDQNQQPQRLKTGLLAIIAIFAMLAAGCGSDTDTAAPADTAEETSAAAPADTAEETSAAEPAQAEDQAPQHIAGPPDEEGMSYNAPFPAGSELSVSEVVNSGQLWSVQVLDVDWDYTQADFPESTVGTYVAVTIEVRNHSEESLDPYQALNWDLGDGEGTFFDKSTQVADEDLVKVGELGYYQSATGVILFEVPPTGMSNGVIGFNCADGWYTWVEVE